MSIAHHTVGFGPRTVLVTHGWLASSQGWGLFPEYLDTDAFTWVFTDIRGYGLRKDVEGDQSAEESARDLVALADELGAERFTIMGHSMGGTVLLRMLTLARDRIDAVVAVSPVGAGPSLFDEDGHNLFWGSVDDRDKRIGVVDFTTGQRNNHTYLAWVADHSLGHSTRDAYAGALEMWANPNFADELSGYEDVPVLLAVGEHDPACGEDAVRQSWLPHFPNARLEVIANAGHYPMHEAPVNLATVVEDFLKA